MEAVAQEVASLRAAAHADPLLSPDTVPPAAVEELTALQAGLGKQAAEVCDILLALLLGHLAGLTRCIARHESKSSGMQPQRPPLTLVACLPHKLHQVARINSYQRLFCLRQGGCDDLATTADDVALKLSLWNGREGEWGARCMQLPRREARKWA
jgi:hypothetical protein